MHAHLTQLWLFFLQGFHFHTHRIQTAVTVVLLLAVGATIIEALATVAVVIRNWFRRVNNQAVITKQDFFNMNAALGSAVSASNYAKTCVIADRSTIAGFDTRLVGFDTRLTGVDALVRGLEKAAITPPANIKEFQLELSNTLDEIRQDVELLLSRTIVLEAQVEELHERRRSARTAKTVKTKKRTAR